MKPPSLPSPSSAHAAQPSTAAPVPLGARSVAFRIGRAAIGLATLVLLGIALFFHPVGDYYAESDFYGGYSDGARLIQHGVVDPRRYVVVGPVYETALALAGWVTRDLFLAGKLLSVASACAALAMWFALMRRHAGDRVAMWSTLFLASNAIVLRHGYSATTDMLATALQISALAALLGTRPVYVVAGGLAGLAVLTRYSAVYLVPAAALSILWLAPPPSSRGRALASWLAAFVATVAPWMIYSVSRGTLPGSILIRSFGFYWNLDASRNVQDLPADSAAAGAYESLAGLLRRDPAGFVARLIGNVPEHLTQDARVLIGWPLALLVLIGAGVAIAGLVRAPRTRARALAAHGGLLFAILVPAFYSERYALPLVPYYAALAGLAAGRVGRSSRAAATVAAIVASAVLIVTASSALTSIGQSLREAPIEVISAGRALAREAPRGSKVMSRKGHIGYYSGLEVAPFPRVRTLRELAESARADGADYLYYSWYETRLRREFGFLLDSTAGVPGLSRVFFTRREPSVVFAIGSGFGRDPDWFADPFQVEVHTARGLVDVFPDSLSWPYRTVLAVDALGREDRAEALRLAELATRSAPHDTLGWVVMGEALRTMGQNERALTAYERALALDPRDPQASIGVGWVLLALGRRRDAARAWRPAITAAADTTTLGAMARVFDSIGDSDAAAAARARRAEPVQTRGP